MASVFILYCPLCNKMSISPPLPTLLVIITKQIALPLLYIYYMAVSVTLSFMLPTFIRQSESFQKILFEKGLLFACMSVKVCVL